MKISGIEMISRPTQVSARLTVQVSAVLIATSVFGLTPQNISFFRDLSITPEAYKWIALFAVVFTAIGLLVNWSGDYVAYSKWFKSNEFNRGARMSDNGIGVPE